jgi:NAD(P)H-dependent flavin oxidoreductase YrpB (nitropropane dioxygenase family)
MYVYLEILLRIWEFLGKMSWWIHKYANEISATKSTSLKTKFTKMFNTSYPIVQAPMTLGVAGVDLVTAVTSAGAVGFIGCGDIGRSRQQHPHFIRVGGLAEKFRRAEYESVHSDLLGIGLNILQLQKDPAFLHQVLGLEPSNIWLGYGHQLLQAALDSSDPWYARPVLERGEGGNYGNKGLNLFIQVTTVAEAVKAAECGAHCVVMHRFSDPAAQGESKIEHARKVSNDNDETCYRGVSRNEFATQLFNVRRTFEANYGQNAPCLLAAGEMTTGKDLLWALEHGADAIVVGTRFATSLEASLPTSTKLHLLQQYTLNGYAHENNFDDESQEHYHQRSSVVNYDDRLINSMSQHMIDSKNKDNQKRHPNISHAEHTMQYEQSTGNDEVHRKALRLDGSHVLSRQVFRTAKQTLEDMMEEAVCDKESPWKSLF